MVLDLISDTNATIVVYTAPGQPSKTLTSFSSSSIQIDVTVNAADRDKTNEVIDVYRKLSGTEQVRNNFHSLHKPIVRSILGSEEHWAFKNKYLGLRTLCL